jgi:hypothetical protein
MNWKNLAKCCILSIFCSAKVTLKILKVSVVFFPSLKQPLSLPHSRHSKNTSGMTFTEQDITQQLHSLAIAIPYSKLTTLLTHNGRSL